MCEQAEQAFDVPAAALHAPEKTGGVVGEHLWNAAFGTVFEAAQAVQVQQVEGLVGGLRGYQAVDGALYGESLQKAGQSGIDPVGLHSMQILYRFVGRRMRIHRRCCIFIDRPAIVAARQELHPVAEAHQSLRYFVDMGGQTADSGWVVHGHHEDMQGFAGHIGSGPLPGRQFTRQQLEFEWRALRQAVLIGRPVLALHQRA